MTSRSELGNWATTQDCPRCGKWGMEIAWTCEETPALVCTEGDYVSIGKRFWRGWGF